MTLALVSQTMEKESGAVSAAPTHPPIHPIDPPLNLSLSTNFTEGQPFEAFKTMREQAPVMWMPGESMDGFWAFTRYKDVREIDLDTKRVSSQAGGILYTNRETAVNHPLLYRSAYDNMICLDAPHHMQLRREHMAYFTPGYVAELKMKVDGEVTRLLDGIAAKGGIVDWVSEFSAQLPLFTLCEILGIPQADRPKIVAWMEMLELAQHMVEQGDMGNIDPQQVMTFMGEVQNLFDFGQSLLKARRKDPQNDLLSAIANTEIDGALLPDEYLDGSWLLIVFAGNDTTRNSISGTMRLLTEFPDAKAELAANPNLIPNAVHEAIRMVSPVMYMRRTATQDTEVARQKIAKGEKLVMYFGAANRDPDVFENPDVFDIHRANAKDHMAFGTGPHVCLGQRVANMQLESAYRQILDRFPHISWTGEQEIAPNAFTHSIMKLMVDVGD